MQATQNQAILNSRSKLKTFEILSVNPSDLDRLKFLLELDLLGFLVCQGGGDVSQDEPKHEFTRHHHHGRKHCNQSPALNGHC